MGWDGEDGANHARDVEAAAERELALSGLLGAGMEFFHHHDLGERGERAQGRDECIHIDLPAELAGDWHFDRRHVDYVEGIIWGKEGYYSGQAGVHCQNSGGGGQELG